MTIPSNKLDNSDHDANPVDDYFNDDKSDCKDNSADNGENKPNM